MSKYGNEENVLILRRHKLKGLQVQDPDIYEFPMV